MKLILLKHSLILLLLTFTFTVSAQENYAEGYIITNEGEIIQGYIYDFTNVATSNLTSVTFRKNINDPDEIYAPGLIQGFSLHGIVYEGGLIDIELSSRKTEQLSTSSELITQQRHVFLQAIILGEKSLYVFRLTAHDLFYIKKDGLFELLGYKKYYSEKKDLMRRSLTVYENKIYQEQLKNYLTDCQLAESEIKSVKYNQTNLTNLFIKYYDCTKLNYTSYSPKRNSFIKLGLLAGYSFTRMDFNYTRQHNNLTYVAQHPVSFGFSLNGRISPKIILIGEYVILTNYKHQLPVEYYEAPGYHSELTYKYYATSMKLSMLARHYVPVKKAYGFGNAGLSLERAVGYNDLELVKTTTLSSNSDLQQFKGIKYFYRLSVGAGIKYKRFSFETRVEPRVLKSYLGTSVHFIGGYTFGSIRP